MISLLSVGAISLSEVNLRPSRVLACGLLFCLSAVFAAVSFLALPVYPKILLLVLVAGFGVRYFCEFVAFSHSNSIRTVRLFEDRWRIKTNRGWFQAWPKGEVVATSFLMCCRFKLEGQRQPVFMILLPDSADVRELHGLRLRLMLDASACLNPENSPE